MNTKKIEWIPEGVAAALMGYAPKTLRRYAREGKLSINYTKVNSRTVEYNKFDIEAIKMKNSTFTTAI
jgi:predicted site-specific integrase-resolvase